MAFEILPPVAPENIHHGCLCCGGTRQIAPMDMLIAVGFGSAQCTKGNDVIYSEDPNAETEEDIPTLQKFEDMAKLDPDHDWRVSLVGPLRDREYQRQGDGHWVLVSSGMGFA